MSEIIAVLGATGQQGGAVVRALHQNGKFSIRAITRNPQSDKAKELASICAEVVKADLDDFESLKKAFKGVYGAFFVTNYFEHLGKVEEEIQQIKNLADAAAAAGVKHAVFSSLEDTRKIIKEGSIGKMYGNYFVPEFDGKGESQDYVRARVPTTVLLAPSYYENFIVFKDILGPKPVGDGTLALHFPMGQTKYLLGSIIDIGKMAAKIFEDISYVGETVGVVGCEETIDSIAEMFTNVLGIPTTYNSMSPAEFAKLGFPGDEDLANMFEYQRDYPKEYKEVRNLKLANKILPDPLPLEKWILANKSALLPK